MKTYKITVIGGRSIVIKTDKLDIQTHKIWGKSIRRQLDQYVVGYIPLSSITEVEEEDTESILNNNKKVQEERDFQKNRKDGETKKQYQKRKSRGDNV